ncbi:MAG: hypothetical protein LUF30_03330 [Lachnospiraceae bacterium]|nr:hypothetical protein [Lachnospiraceae bacterium]
MGFITKLFGHGRKTSRKEDALILPRHYNLGEDYYLAMDQKPNGLGGYADVNIGMYKGEKLIRQITDASGKFLDFPGVVHGKCEDTLRFTLK